VHLCLGDFRAAEQAPETSAALTPDPVHRLRQSSQQPFQAGADSCAFFYCRKALAESAFLEPHWKAIARNRLANLYLIQSYFQEAIAEYREALRIAREAGLAERWPTEHYLDNLGYCLILVGEHREGILHIHEALGLARPRRNRRCITGCFRISAASPMQRALCARRRCTARALGMALRKRYTDIIETATTSTGEIRLQGQEKESDFYFENCRSFGTDFLKDFLKTFDVSRSQLQGQVGCDDENRRSLFCCGGRPPERPQCRGDRNGG
jgi:tetratricopeptide (TPR) repeat protein